MEEAKNGRAASAHGDTEEIGEQQVDNEAEEEEEGGEKREEMKMKRLWQPQANRQLKI